MEDRPETISRAPELRTFMETALARSDTRTTQVLDAVTGEISELNQSVILPIDGDDEVAVSRTYNRGRGMDVTRICIPGAIHMGASAYEGHPDSGFLVVSLDQHGVAEAWNIDGLSSTNRQPIHDSELVDGVVLLSLSTLRRALETNPEPSPKTKMFTGLVGRLLEKALGKRPKI